VAPEARAQCREGCDRISNTYLGNDTLGNVTTGGNNTAVGDGALAADTVGNINTAVGVLALGDNTGGGENTALGWGALRHNTTGSDNTATGSDALSENTTGHYNTANGEGALLVNTIGNYNTASGYFALVLNTAGNNNTAAGDNALSANTIGNDNTATGSMALAANTSGFRNTANGLSSLANNSTGNQNTAEGANALFRNTTGAGNVASGYNALLNNTTGGFNTALGASAGSKLTTGSNNIDIASHGLAGEANTIRVGTQGTQTNTYVAGIYGTPAAEGINVLIDSTGHLGTITSSARFKDQIKPMDTVSESLFSLKPVTFRYKKELDPKAIPQFGLVAEDVARVDPALVARDEEGKPYTVRYEAVNAMLLNEFLKAHRKAETQEEKIIALTSVVADQQQEIAALAARIQKVSERHAVEKPAARIASNKE